jgi:RimJ/RimL family protein N-acetyltransferase
MIESSPGGPVLETERLRLHLLSADSAADIAFMLRILNEPSFIQNIGDRGVRTLEQARDYLRERPVSSYLQHGYGMYSVEVKASGATAGHCGLVRREVLEGPDLGYAFLPEFRSQGYAAESAAGVLAYAREKLGLDRILAIVNPDNASSIRLLQKLGFRFERMVRLSEDDIALKLFVSEAES